RLPGGLLAIVLGLAGLQALALTAAALAAAPVWRMLAPLFHFGLAAAAVLLAIEDAGAPSVRRRRLVGGLQGGRGGFGVGPGLADAWQFAGARPRVGLASFTAGVVLGEGAACLAGMAGLALVFRYATGRRLGVIILSLILGHAACHWMLDVEHSAEHAVAT